MSPGNEVYKCVNWIKNVNTQLAFFAFAVVLAEGVSDVQHWVQCCIIACPYGSIPVRQTEFQTEKYRSKYMYTYIYICFYIFIYMFIYINRSIYFYKWLHDAFLCVKITFRNSVI